MLYGLVGQVRADSVGAEGEQQRMVANLAGGRRPFSEVTLENNWIVR